MLYKSLSSIQKMLKSNTGSVVEMVQYYLENIKSSAHLNIYIETYDSEALEKAKLLDLKIKQKPTDLGKLFGMIISIKDVIAYKNHKLTAGSHILDDFESQITSTVLQRAMDEDAIVIGRTNCDEFAMGSTNANSYYGPTYNGVNPEYIPGGSSGGAAVSVQMNTCLIGIGSDTGGSVRQPAAFCGLFGFKPSYGRLSRWGVVAYASSLDQIGYISKNMDDIASILDVTMGSDPLDASSNISIPEKILPFNQEKEDYKIAVITSFFDSEKLNKEIQKASYQFISSLPKKHTTTNIAMELKDYLVPCYYTISTAEASSNLGRYDGVRYGLNVSQDKTDVRDFITHNRTAGFGLEVKRRIILGTYVLSEGFYDAYYNQALKIRRLIKEWLESVFETHDFILLPTTTSSAWKNNSFQDDPVEVYLADVFTVLANLGGIPAVSIPLGTTKNGLPFGIQILAKRMDEKKICEFVNSLTLEQSSVFNYDN